MPKEEGLLRSAHMSLIQLYMPLEVAQSTIAELGELGICQFKDVPTMINRLS
jgi:V-type H+-transporting ATPase subunit a